MPVAFEYEGYIISPLQPQRRDSNRPFAKALSAQLGSGWHTGRTVWSIHLLGTDSLTITYLSSAAFVVGRRSRFDRRMLTPAPSTWQSTFRRFLEGGSAAAPPFSLSLRRPCPCISRLEALREACGDCWGSLGGLGESAGVRWSLSAALGEPSCDCWCSRAALSTWRH